MCILYTVIRYSRRKDPLLSILEDPPLSILGDFLQSFLQESDKSTEGMSIASKVDFESSSGDWKNLTAKVWQPKNFRWYRAASWRRWCSTLGM